MCNVSYFTSLLSFCACQETPHYPVHWIVQADNFDGYKACSRRFNNPCKFALCDKGRCRTSSYVAAGAGLSVTGEFGQEVEVDLTKLAPGDTNGMVEVLYQVNLPYRRDAVGKRNLVVLKKYRFNFRDFVYNCKYFCKDSVSIIYMHNL